MIVYTVHEPEMPSSEIEERASQIVFVKEGFTFFGFALAPVWLLVNRLWFEFLAVVAFMSLTSAALMSSGPKMQLSASVNLALALIIGFEGNNLIRWRLERKGYRFLATVAGRNFEECERRFFDAWVPQVVGNGPSTMGRAMQLQPVSASPQPWKSPSAIGTLPGSVS